MEAGASTRQLKVARELQKALAEIIRSKGMAGFDGAMLTVTEIRISPDLSFAKVYISAFPSNKLEKSIQILQDNVKQYRGELGRIIAKQFRIIPELAFYPDSSLDYAEHIDELLKK